MIKGILMLGVGVAAVGVARFCTEAIHEERERRHGARATHETTRWEGEGGHVRSPHTAGMEGAAAG